MHLGHATRAVTLATDLAVKCPVADAPHRSALDELCPSGLYPAIAAAHADSIAEKTILTELVSDKLSLPPDSTLVAFGSLAREEWSSGSDLDWVLLVDGQVSPAHFSAMLKAQRELEHLAPGATGTFGGLVFSHQLVHLIGGQDDSNRNLTLRMLLLLESVALGQPPTQAYDRVLNALLSRYLIEPSSFSQKKLTPRFLLNDLIRYWRTLGVDFADKFHDQAGKKAVLRNVKLRFSRKLIYTAGLYSCLRWYETQPQPNASETLDHFRHLATTPPLEIIAQACLDQDASPTTREAIFTNYEIFLLALRDKREELEQLPPGQAAADPLFNHLRDASHPFENALMDLLAAKNLRSQLVRYAIF